MKGVVEAPAGDQLDPESLIKINQNEWSTFSRIGDQLKPEWVIKMRQNMQIYRIAFFLVSPFLINLSNVSLVSGVVA